MTNTPPPPAPTATVAVPEEKGIEIYIAARPIAVGAKIAKEDLAIQEWPKHLVLPGFVKVQPESNATIVKADTQPAVGASTIVNSIARASFQQDEPIIASKLANPNDPNFLAATLPQGMRIITIVTNETEGLAGFIFPGDHVDVILTHDVEQPHTQATATNGAVTFTQTKQNAPVAETLLNNVTVVAVDQRASGDGSVDKDGKLIVPRSVSLMVSQLDAQRIRLGQKVGTLTLSLRSLKDKDSADPATLVLPNDLTQYKSEAAQFSGGGESGIKIYRGTTADAPANGTAPNNMNLFGPATTGSIPGTSTPAITGQ